MKQLLHERNAEDEVDKTCHWLKLTAMELKRHHIEGKACLARDVALLFDRITNLFFVATLKDMASSIHFCALLLLFRLNPVSSCLDGKFPACFLLHILFSSFIAAAN